MTYLVFICPHCGRARASPDGVKTLKCPACRRVFKANKAKIVARVEGMKAAAHAVRVANDPRDNEGENNCLWKESSNSRPDIETWEEEGNDSDKTADTDPTELIAYQGREVSGGKKEKLLYAVDKLTEMKGDFDIADLCNLLDTMKGNIGKEEVVSMVEAMMRAGIVIEHKSGRFRYIGD